MINIKFIEIKDSVKDNEVLKQIVERSVRDSDGNEFHVVADLERMRCTVELVEAVGTILTIPSYVLLDGGAYKVTRITKSPDTLKNTIVERLVLPPVDIEDTELLLDVLPELTDIELFGRTTSKFLNGITKHASIKRIITHDHMADNGVWHYLNKGDGQKRKDICHAHIDIDIENIEDIEDVVRNAKTVLVSEAGREVPEFENSMVLNIGDLHEESLSDGITTLTCLQTCNSDRTVFEVILDATNEKAILSIIRSTATKVVIPSRIICGKKHFKVICIKSVCSESVEKIIITSTIANIEKEAFKGASKLKSLVFNCEKFKWNSGVFRGSNINRVICVDNSDLCKIIKCDYPDITVSNTLTGQDPIASTAHVMDIENVSDQKEYNIVENNSSESGITARNEELMNLALKKLEALLPTSLYAEASGATAVEKITNYLLAEREAK